MNQIAAFNSLRFFTVLIILFFHFGLELRIKDYPFAQGRLGVEVFFILSGFLLAAKHKKLTTTVPSPTAEQMCKSYFIHRFLRLWPEYIFTLLISMLLLGLFDKTKTQAFLLSAFMIPCYPEVSPIFNVLWYVPVLFIGSCLLFNILSFAKDKAKTIIFPIIALLCLFFLLNDKSHFARYTLNGSARGLLGLITGMYTYWGCLALKTCKISWRPQFVTWTLLVGEVVSVIGLIYLLIFQKGYGIALFNVYFYASFLIGLLFFHREKLLKFLSWRIWAPFTKISYSLYLTHYILLRTAKAHLLPYIKSYVLSSSILLVIVSIIFATLCYLGQKYLFMALKKIALRNNVK